MILKYIVFLFFYFYSFNLYSTNVRVIDFQRVIDSNNELVNLISKIEEDQAQHRKKFNEIEIKLKDELDRIEELKLILEKLELDKEINKYNTQLNQFNKQINEFNNHYESQINILKNKIIEKVLEILRKYSLDNQIDLILDANNYILSSNSINITNLIIDELNKIEFDTSFEEYK